MGGFVGGVVREVDPVPGGDQHVLALDVTVADPLLVALRKRVQQLERHPPLACQRYGSGVMISIPEHVTRMLAGSLHLLDAGQEGARAETMVEVGEDVLPDEIGRFLGMEEALQRPYVRAR